MAYRGLITGIAGFAGSFLAEHLLDCGDAVLGCSPDGAWEKTSPQALQAQVALVAWDLADPEGISAEWTDDQIRSMAGIAYGLPHMWDHAIGPGWESRISVESLESIFRRL